MDSAELREALIGRTLERVALVVLDDCRFRDPTEDLITAAEEVAIAAEDAEDAALDGDQDEAESLLIAAAAAAVRGIVQAGPDA